MTSLNDLEGGLLYLKADAEQLRELITCFIDEKFKDRLPAGSFDALASNMVGSMQQALKAQASLPPAPNLSVLLSPQLHMPLGEWKKKIGYGLYGYPPVTSNQLLSQCWYYISQQDISKATGKSSYYWTIARQDLNLEYIWPSAAGLGIHRLICQEAGLDMAQASTADIKATFVTLYPQAEAAVTHNGNIDVQRLMSAHAILHGNASMFPYEIPALTHAAFKELLLSNKPRSRYGLAHYYLVATAPDYKAFTDALCPYYTRPYAV